MGRPEPGTLGCAPPGFRCQARDPVSEGKETASKQGEKCTILDRRADQRWKMIKASSSCRVPPEMYSCKVQGGTLDE